MATTKGKDYTVKATVNREQKMNRRRKFVGKINEKRKQNENVKTRPERETDRAKQLCEKIDKRKGDGKFKNTFSPIYLYSKSLRKFWEGEKK